MTLLAVGAVAGFAAGLFGIGGGAVMVPALYFTFTALGYGPDITMHMAVATSAAVIIVNSIRSVWGHNKHGAVDWDILWPTNPFRSYALWIAIGSLLAALLIAPKMSGQALTILFAVVSTLIALQFIFGRPDWRLRDSVPGGAGPPVIGGIIGTLSALMGIGGGSISVPFMLICGVPIHRAVATASGFGLAIAAPATLGFIISGWNKSGRPDISMGYVNFLGFLLIVVTAFVTVPLGVSAAHKLSQKRLKMIFGICLIVIALNMLRKAIA